MQNQDVYTINIRSINVIIGDIPISSDEQFRHFDIKVTDDMAVHIIKQPSRANVIVRIGRVVHDIFSLNKLK